MPWPDAYIDPEASMDLPPRAAHFVRLWGLSEADVEVARDTMRRVRAYRRWYYSNLRQGHGEEYDGESANDFVNRRMAGRSVKEKVRVLQVAVALADEADVDMKSRTKPEIKRLREAS